MARGLIGGGLKSTLIDGNALHAISLATDGFSATINTVGYCALAASLAADAKHLRPPFNDLPFRDFSRVLNADS